MTFQAFSSLLIFLHNFGPNKSVSKWEKARAMYTLHVRIPRVGMECERAYRKWLLFPPPLENCFIRRFFPLLFHSGSAFGMRASSPPLRRVCVCGPRGQQAVMNYSACSVRLYSKPARHSVSREILSLRHAVSQLIPWPAFDLVGWNIKAARADIFLSYSREREKRIKCLRDDIVQISLSLFFPLCDNISQDHFIHSLDARRGVRVRRCSAANPFYLGMSEFEWLPEKINFSLQKSAGKSY